jgi:hypothetical protein
MTEAARTAARNPGGRRAPHPAQGARIAAAGFGTAATLVLVGAMSMDESARSGLPTPDATSSVIILPPRGAASTTGGSTPPVVLRSEPSTRVVSGGPTAAPQPLRVDATTSGSR